MVAGMRDDFYKLISKNVTIYGIKGINVNYSDKDTLKVLDPQINDDVAGRIIQRRSSMEEGGPFKDEEEFISFLGTLISVAEFNEEKIPLLFEPVYNFRITSTGTFARSSSEITAITYDIDNLTGRMVTLLNKQEEEKNAQNSSKQGTNTNQSPANSSNPPPNKNKTKKKAVPKGQPRIVYWHET